MQVWIVKDWVGNRLFPGETFASFEDGWARIYEQWPEPEKDSPEWLDGWFDDFYVELAAA